MGKIVFFRKKRDMYSRNKRGGFSLIEVLLAVAIIGVLASMVFMRLDGARQKAYLVRATKELRSIHESVELFRAANNEQYPADASRDIPPGLEEYLAPGIWPDAAWPGSVFDWDAWEDPSTHEDIYQISVRFCPIGHPEQCQFPDMDWAEDFDINSAVFYCVKGPCRAHTSRPVNHPGYCVNCPEPQYPYGIY